MGSGNRLSLPYTDFYMSAGDLYSESQKLRQAPPKKSVLSYTLCSPTEESLVSNSENALSHGPGLAALA